jgi:hypothetical protein
MSCLLSEIHRGLHRLQFVHLIHREQIELRLSFQTSQQTFLSVKVSGIPFTCSEVCRVLDTAFIEVFEQICCSPFRLWKVHWLDVYAHVQP